MSLVATSIPLYFIEEFYKMHNEEAGPVPIATQGPYLGGVSVLSPPPVISDSLNHQILFNNLTMPGFLK